VPTTADGIEAYLEEMRPKLYANDTVQEFLKLTEEADVFGRWAQPIQRLLVQAAIDLLPPALQTQCGVSAKPPNKIRPYVKALARVGGFLQRRVDGPPQQACRRVGVPTSVLG
jgi:uncharacterized protein (DUF2236 family)